MGFHKAPHTFVSHVALKVEDIEQSLRFYQGIIGFQILEQTEDKVLLTADGRRELISIEQPDDVIPKQGGRTGLYHIALLLPKRADLAQVVQHLLEHGYRFGSSDHLVSEAIYLTDPDGNGIEIYADRPASTWQWQDGLVDMATEPLDFQNLLTETKEGVWQGLPAATVVGHIHLQVAELGKTEKFYREGLGFELVSRYGSQAVFMSTGGYHHHLALNTWAGVGLPAPEPNSVGLKSFTLQYTDREARAKVIEQLRELGTNYSEVDGVIYTEDPAGNQLQLLV